MTMMIPTGLWNISGHREGTVEGACVRTEVMFWSAEAVVLTLGKSFKAQISCNHIKVLRTSCLMLAVMINEIESMHML